MDSLGVNNVFDHQVLEGVVEGVEGIDEQYVFDYPYFLHALSYCAHYPTHCIWHEIANEQVDHSYLPESSVRVREDMADRVSQANQAQPKTHED